MATAVLTAGVTAPSPFGSLVPARAVAEALIAAGVRDLGDAPRAGIAAYDAYGAQRHGTGAGPPPASRSPEDPLPARNAAR